MIAEKAKELLGKLRRTHYREKPDFGLDSLSETIISIIVNECKSTILQQDNSGDIRGRRYESDIIKDNLEQIIRQLILNGGKIPKEVMRDICYWGGRRCGVEIDVGLYKGVRENEDGTVENIGTIGNSVIDVYSLSPEILESIQEALYISYSREFIWDNIESLPPISRVSKFIDKVLHGSPETRERYWFKNGRNIKK